MSKLSESFEKFFSAVILGTIVVVVLFAIAHLLDVMTALFAPIFQKVVDMPIRVINKLFGWSLKTGSKAANDEVVDEVVLPIKEIDKHLFRMETQLNALADAVQNEDNFVILEGPSGTGKHVAIDMHFNDPNKFEKHVWVSAVEHDYYQYAIEARLNTFFKDAIKRSKESPGKTQVLVMDNFETLCNKSVGLTTKKTELIAALGTNISALKSNKIILVGTTSDVLKISKDLVDRSVRIKFNVPLPNDRKLLLNQVSRLDNITIDVEHAVTLTRAWSYRSIQGFMAKIKKLARGAAVTINHISRAYDGVIGDIQDDFASKYADAALTLPKYTSVMAPDPLGHLTVVQANLANAFRRFYRSMTDLHTNTHLLLTGPSGNGKTHAVREFAKHAAIPFIYVESLQATVLSSLLSAARGFNKCIIFIDEFDMSVRKGSAETGDLQKFMDGYKDYSHVRIVAATNHPQNIAVPLLNRFTQVEVGYMSVSELQPLLQLKMAVILQRYVQMDEVLQSDITNNYEIIAKACAGLSVREIEKAITNINADIPVNHSDYTLTMQAVLDAIDVCQEQHHKIVNPVSSDRGFGDILSKLGLNGTVSPLADPAGMALVSQLLPGSSNRS